MGALPCCFWNCAMHCFMASAYFTFLSSSANMAKKYVAKPWSAVDTWLLRFMVLRFKSVRAAVSLRSEWRLLSWRLLRRMREKNPQAFWASCACKKAPWSPKSCVCRAMLVSYRTLASQVIEPTNGRISARGTQELGTTSNYSAAPAQVNKTTDGDK